MDTDPTTAAPVRLPGVSQQRPPSTPAGPDALSGLQPALAAEVPEQLTGRALHRDQVGDAVPVEVADAGEVAQPLPAGADPGAGAERAARRTWVQPQVTGAGLPGQQVDPAVPIEVADRGDLPNAVPAAAADLDSGCEPRAGASVQPQAPGGLLPSDDVLAA